MNYASKFDGKSFIDGMGAHANNGHAPGHSVAPHTTHAPADAIIVPDAHLLFNGDFKRSGVDLILSADNEKLVLHDYFKGEKRAALASPDGAHLTGDIVKALAGHVEYAQAADGSASVNKVIGHVTKLIGSATAIRNGVSITLNQGENVEKGDVVQSGAGSTVGITFIDGTVFGLSSNARMVLNEMVYDPNGSNNSSLLSLVAGTITFVAGETAKHGDMKIDTPVATMGIRGTAVLVEIDFDTAGQNGLPDTKFQVLVEPDGTTGSYILFDKVTLTPFAIVDKAGTQFSFSNGNFSQSLTGLTPEIQKLITDVFAQKFTDNSNPRTFDHHTDTPIPDSFSPFKVGNITVTPIILTVNGPVNAPAQTTNFSGPQIQHISKAPDGVIVNALGQVSTDFKFTEIPGVTGSATPDKVSGAVNFADVNAGDQPTVSAKFDGSTYTDPHGHALSLNSQQLADIKAVEVDLAVTQTPGNNNNGSAGWSYTVPDGSFDFLAAGETLQLTYTLTVDNNYAPNDQKTDLKFTITITGTNDVPVITTGAQTISFIAGKGTVGGDLAPSSETSGVNVNHPTTLSYSEKGTLAFTDPDLTDTHTIVSTGPTGDLTGASLSGTTLDLAALEAKYPGPFQTFETALTASIGKDSTGTGTGSINWSFAELPAYVADFIPSGQTLTLTYTVEVKDSQGAISTQTITVTITGNDNPAVVWKDTAPAPPSGALWSDGSNWGTGKAPTISDDTIIITNQLQPNAPTYPVVINAAAAAQTLLMDDPTGLLAPELDNHNTLTIAGGLNMSADAILKNFGDISVGSLATLLASGLAEFSNHSVLDNSGTIELAHGGDFLDQSSITNSGTIEVVADTLNVAVAIANAGGIIKIDDGAELKLHGAIHGGTINNGTANGTVVGNGTVFGNIDVTANSTIDGNAILNHGDVTIESGVILTLDNVTVNGATFADTASGAIIQIDDGTTLTLNGATINGGTINDGTANGTSTESGTVFGNIDVTGDSTISGASLNNGGVTVDAKLTLDNVKVTGATFTDTASGAIIQVDDGTTLTLSGVTIDGGTINDGTANGTSTEAGTVFGNIDVTGNSKIDSNASLNNGGVKIESGVILTLDNVTVNGTTFADTASGAIIQIDDGTTLTLNGATINGGTINDGTANGTGNPAVFGSIVVTGDSTISNANLNNGSITIDEGISLTLTNDTVTGTSIIVDGVVNKPTPGNLILQGGTTLNGSNVTIDNADQVTLNGATITGGAISGSGTIDVIGASEINGNASLGNAGVTIESGVILTLDNVTVTGTTFTDTASGAIIQVDDGTTLTLSGATIDGGAINDGTANGTSTEAGTVFGNIDVAGNTKIDSNAHLNNGYVTIESGKILTLDNVTVTGTTFTDTASGAIIQVDDGTTLTLSGATIDGGAINDGTLVGGLVASTGLIDVTGNTKIDSNASLNNGYVTVESGKILTLDNVTATGTTFTDTASGAVIQIDNGTKLTLSGVTIDGGAINDGTIVGGPVASTGLIDVTGDTKIDSNASLNNGYVTIESGKTLTLDNVTVTGTKFTDKASDSTLQVDGGTTLTLSGATIDGGTITSGANNVPDTPLVIATDTAGDQKGITSIVVGNNILYIWNDLNGGGLQVREFNSAGQPETAEKSLSAVAPDAGLTTVTLADGNFAILVYPGMGRIVDASGNVLHSFSYDDSAGYEDAIPLTGGGFVVTDSGDGSTGVKFAVFDSSGNQLNTFGASGSFAEFNIHKAVPLADGGFLFVWKNSAGALVADAFNADGTERGSSPFEVDAGGGGEVRWYDDLNMARLPNGQILMTWSQADGPAHVIYGRILDSSGNLIAGSAGTAFEISQTSGNVFAPRIAIGSAGQIIVTWYEGSYAASWLAPSDGKIDYRVIDQSGNPLSNEGVLTTQVPAPRYLQSVSLPNGTIVFAWRGTDSSGEGIHYAVVGPSGNIIQPDTLVDIGHQDGDQYLGALGNLVVTADGSVWLSISDSSPATDGSGYGVTAVKLFDGAGAVPGNIAVTSDSTINGAALNNVLVTIDSGVMLTLDNVTATGTTFTDTASGAVIKIDNGTTLTLSGVTIDGGTINDGTVVGGLVSSTGLIDVTGNTKIDSNASLNDGYVKIESGKILTLDNVTATGTTFTDTASGAVIQIDNGTTLTLSGVTIDGGAINDGTLVGGLVASTGLIDVTGNTKIDSNAQLNNGYVTIESGKILTLDNVTVTGTTFTDTASGAILSIDATDTLTLSGVTINGGTINDGTGTTAPTSGHIHVTGTSAITNATLSNGDVTISSGTTLTLDGDTVNGTLISGTDLTSIIQVGATSGSILTLDDGASIKNGALTIAGSSTLDVESTGGATLDGVSVTGTGTTGPSASLIEIGASTTSGSILTLDDGTIIKNGSVTIAGGSKLDVESTGGATLDGVSVTGTGTTVPSASLIEIGASTASGSILTLDDSTKIKNGALTVAGGSTLDVESTGGATLDGVTVTGTGTTGAGASTIAVGAHTASGSVLMLDDGTAIINGSLTIAAGSLLDIEKGAIGPGATLDGVTVTGTGTSGAGSSTIDVGITASGATILLLDDGTSIKNGSLAIASGSTLDVETAGGATLDHVTVTGTTGVGASAITVGAHTASGSVLMLDDGTSITNGTLTIAAGSILDIEKGATGTGATLDGVTVTGTGTTGAGASTIDVGTTASGATILLLDDGTTITKGSLKIAGGSTLDIEKNATTGPSATLDGVTVTGTGTTGAGASTIAVGATTGSGSVLLLDDGTTIINGSLTIASGSILDVESIGGATLDGVTVANSGHIDIGTTTTSSDEDPPLKLDDHTVITGGTIAMGALGVLDVEKGLAVLAPGTSDATLDNVAVTSSAAGSAITIGASGAATLLLTDGASTTNVDITVNAGSTLDLDGSTITGGTLTILGELDSTGTNSITDATIVNSSHIDIVSGTLTIDPTPVTNTGTIEVKGDGTLVLSGETITNSVTTADGTTNGIIKVDASESAHATLDLENSTIGGGTVTISGEMDSTGTSAINGADVTNSGTIDVATGALTFDTASTLHNSGMTKVDSGATLTIHGHVDNSGTLETNGGTLVIGADAVITGTSPDVTIHGGTADFVGTGAPLALNATFSGAGTLVLEDSQHYTGTITGYGAGDTIDLTDLTYTQGETSVWNSATDILTITSGSQTVSLHLAGTFGQNDFAITQDANGHTELVSNAGLSQPQVTMTGLDSAGNAVAGNSVTANFSPPGSGNSGSVTYTWLEDGHVVQTGASEVFTPGVADAGKVLDVVVGFGNEQITNVAGAVVAPPAVSFNDPGGATTNSGTPLTLSSLNLTFADAGSDSFTVTLTAGHGTLSLTTPGTLTEGGTGGTLTLTGTLADIDTALGHGLVYTPANGYSGSDTISMSAQDGAFTSNTATLGVTVAVPTPPIAATINFDDVPAGTSGTALSDYFANYGVTLESGGGNANPMIEDSRGNAGGGFVDATTGNNVFGENGGNPPANYTVTFAHALTSFAFDRVQENAGPNGETYAAWTATAYDAQGHVLSTISSEHETTVSVDGNSVPAMHYVLTGADIDHVTFTETDPGGGGADHIQTDSWVLIDAPAAPAATTLVWNTSSADWATSTDWSPNGVPNSAEDANVTAASASPYTVTIGNNETAQADTLHLDSTAATINDRGSLNLAGDLVIDHGTFELDNGHLQARSIEVAATGTFQGINGVVDGPVSVSGVVEALGTLEFAGYVTGTGTFNIDPSSTLKFDGPVSAGSVVSFANAHDNFGGHGTLNLANAATFQGQISGFAVGDVLDLGGLQSNQSDTLHASSGTYNSVTGTTLVTVTDTNDGQSTSVTLAGDYSNVLWAAAADGQGGVNIAEDNVTMTLSAGPYDIQGSVDVKVTVLDGLTGHAVSGVEVTPSFTSNAGFGAFNGINAMAGDNSPQSTGTDGTAGFTFNPFEFSGTFDISTVVGGVETLSQQIVVAPESASNSNSSLKSVLNFSGPTETATLTLTDQGFLHNPRPGDAVTWNGAGTFSPASGNGVTDADGHLIDTFTPASDTQQTVTANFDDTSVSTNVNFVTMDEWINTSGGTWNDTANAATNWSEGHIPTAGEGVWIGSAGTYTVDVTAVESVFGLGTLATATLEIGNGGTLSVIGTGNSVLAGALTVDTGGEFLAQNGVVQLNGAVTNDHVLEAQSGATINIAGGIAGTGSIVADGAVVNVAGSVAGTQAINITGAGVAHLAQAEAGQITFSGAGMLALDAAPMSGMTVHNFGVGDSIDLTNLAYSSNPAVESLSWNSSTNTLTVTDGTTSESIAFAEGHSLSDFALTADPLGTGGTDIIYTHAVNYSGAVTSSLVPLSNGGGSDTIGNINNAGVTVVSNTNENYFYTNGHLILLPGAPDNAEQSTSSYQEIPSSHAVGINDSDRIVETFYNATGSGAQYQGTYLGGQDVATGLPDASSGGQSSPILSGLTAFESVNGHYFQAGLGVNDNGLIVGTVVDEYSLDEEQLDVSPIHAFNFRGPTNDGEYFGHEYGLIYNPNFTNGYTIISAGSTNNVVNGNTASNAGVNYFGGQNPIHNGVAYGVAYTVLTGVNNAGLAVGYYMDGDSVEHAFLFDTVSHAFTFIPDQGGGGFMSTVATGINNEGLVVGYYGLTTATGIPLLPTDHVSGFVYDSNTGTFLTTNFTNADGHNLGLMGINDLGLVTGEESNGNMYVANLNPVVTIDNGGTLYVTSATNETINFAGGTGELVLSSATTFHGQITGFTGTAPDAAHSDVIDLGGINYLTLNSPVSSNHFVASYSSGFLVVTDGLHASASFSFENYNGNFAFTSDGHGGTLIFDPPSGPATIANGALYEVTSASSDTIAFAGNAGALQLDSPASFTGHIAGFAGTAPDAAHSDVLDLAGIDFNSTKFAESYQSATGELTVTDGTNSAKFTLDNFNGTLGFASDGNGGTAITAGPSLSGPQMAVVPSAVTDTQPAASTLVATAPNQTLTGNAVSDTFAFNFASVGQATVTNFHAATDTLQFNSQLFANVQAALNATQDDGHGNTVITIDAHDAITLSGVVKAQLHASDFHFA